MSFDTRPRLDLRQRLGEAVFSDAHRKQELFVIISLSRGTSQRDLARASWSHVLPFASAAAQSWVLTGVEPLRLQKRRQLVRDRHIVQVGKHEVRVPV